MMESVGGLEVICQLGSWGKKSIYKISKSHQLNIHVCFNNINNILTTIVCSVLLEPVNSLNSRLAYELLPKNKILKPSAPCQ